MRIYTIIIIISLTSNLMSPPGWNVSGWSWWFLWFHQECALKPNGPDKRFQPIPKTKRHENQTVFPSSRSPSSTLVFLHYFEALKKGCIGRRFTWQQRGVFGTLLDLCMKTYGSGAIRTPPRWCKGENLHHLPWLKPFIYMVMRSILEASVGEYAYGPWSISLDLTPFTQILQMLQTSVQWVAHTQAIQGFSGSGLFRATNLASWNFMHRSGISQTMTSGVTVKSLAHFGDI